MHSIIVLSETGTYTDIGAMKWLLFVPKTCHKPKILKPQAKNPKPQWQTYKHNLQGQIHLAQLSVSPTVQ